MDKEIPESIKSGKKDDGMYDLQGDRDIIWESCPACAYKHLTAAYALHPAFGEAELIEIGVDARPAFRDNLPRIRRRGSRIYVNGLYRHSFLLAPALARMAADLVTGGPRPEVMDEDRAER